MAHPSRSCVFIIVLLVALTHSVTRGDDMPQGQIQGHVFDENGKPISGARVTTYPRIPGDDSLTALTDDDGRFAFDLSDLVEKTISSELNTMMAAVHKAGYAITGLNGDQMPIRVTLRRPDTVNLTILDPNGMPLANARLEPGEIQTRSAFMIFPPPESWRDDFALRTDDKGAATMRSARRHELRRVIVSTPEWGTQRLRLPIVQPDAPVQPVQVQLQSAGVVRGRLLDLKRNPVAGKRVDAMTAELGNDWQLDSVVTDSEGRFEFKLPTGPYHLSCMQEGFAAGPLDVELDDQQPKEVVLLEVEHLQVYGRVVTEGGRPVGKVPLAFWSNLRRKFAATDLDGRFELTLPKGNWKYRCSLDSSPGYLRQSDLITVEVTGEDDIELPDVIVQTGQVVEGVIRGIDTDESRIRVVRAQVENQRVWCSYDKDGRFQLTIPRSANAEKLTDFEVRFVDRPVEVVSFEPFVIKVMEGEEDPPP